MTHGRAWMTYEVTSHGDGLRAFACRAPRRSLKAPPVALALTGTSRMSAAGGHRDGEARPRRARRLTA